MLKSLFGCFSAPRLGPAAALKGSVLTQHLLTKRAACCPVKTREPWYNVNSFLLFAAPLVRVPQSTLNKFLFF